MKKALLLSWVLLSTTAAYHSAVAIDETLTDDSATISPTVQTADTAEIIDVTLAVAQPAVTEKTQTVDVEVPSVKEEIVMEEVVVQVPVKKLVPSTETVPVEVLVKTIDSDNSDIAIVSTPINTLTETDADTNTPVSSPAA